MGEIVTLIDKQERSNPPFQALAGYYHRRRGAELRECVEGSVAAGERELSDVLHRYMAAHPIQAEPAREWFDFGHIDNLVSARRRLLQPRYVNALTIKPVLNTITKVSQHSKKLEEELAWFQLIPDELKMLTPRVLTTRDADGNVAVSQEYYGHPTLAELYVYGDLPTDIWRSVLRKVLLIHQEFGRHAGELEPEYVRAMYQQKTWERLDLLRGQDPFWQALLDAERVVYQGRRLQGAYALREAIDARAEALAQSAPISIIHGDYCFSNILFDINNQIVRLIDPRGSFGKSGIYGDARYEYHEGHPQRQRMLYLTGLSLLNDVLSRRSSRHSPEREAQVSKLHGRAAGCAKGEAAARLPVVHRARLAGGSRARRLQRRASADPIRRVHQLLRPQRHGVPQPLERSVTLHLRRVNDREPALDEAGVPKAAREVDALPHETPWTVIRAPRGIVKGDHPTIHHLREPELEIPTDGVIVMPAVDEQQLDGLFELLDGVL